MITKYLLRINKEIDYSVLYYDNTFDYPTFNFIVEGTSADALAEAMANVTLLQIFDVTGASLIKSTNKYATVQGISFIPAGTYVDDEGKNIPCIKITLKEADVTSRIEKIESDIYEQIDVDKMSLSEYKEYKKALVSEDCQLAIEAGVDFNTGDTIEHFTYYTEDQINFADMNSQVEAGFPIIPYHSSNDDSTTSPCKMYPASVIRGIYVAQLTNKLIQTTKCNHIYQWIDGLDSKEAIQNITFASELPEPYLTSFNELITNVQNTMGEKDMTKTISETVVATIMAQFEEVKKEITTTVLDGIAKRVQTIAETKNTQLFNSNKENLVQEAKNAILLDLDNTIIGKVDAYFGTKTETIVKDITEAVLEELANDVLDGEEVIEPEIPVEETPEVNGETTTTEGETVVEGEATNEEETQVEEPVATEE